MTRKFAIVLTTAVLVLSPTAAFADDLIPPIDIPPVTVPTVPPIPPVLQPDPDPVPSPPVATPPASDPGQTGSSTGTGSAGSAGSTSGGTSTSGATGSGAGTSGSSHAASAHQSTGSSTSPGTTTYVGSPRSSASGAGIFAAATAPGPVLTAAPSDTLSFVPTYSSDARATVPDRPGSNPLGFRISDITPTTWLLAAVLALGGLAIFARSRRRVKYR